MTQWHSQLAFGEPRTLIAGAVFARRLPSAILLREIPQKPRGADLLFSVVLVEIFLVTISQQKRQFSTEDCRFLLIF